MINIVLKFDVGLLKSALQINHSLGKYKKVGFDRLYVLKKFIKARIIKVAKENSCTFPGMITFGTPISLKPITGSDED